MGTASKLSFKEAVVLDSSAPIRVCFGTHQPRIYQRDTHKFTDFRIKMNNDNKYINTDAIKVGYSKV